MSSSSSSSSSFSKSIHGNERRIVATSSSSNDQAAGGVTTTTTTTTSPSNVVWMAGIFMLGASAGLTLYTRRTQSMIRQMEKVSQQQKVRRGPVQFGPPTREEWDKIRPRLEKDGDFF